MSRTCNHKPCRIPVSLVGRYETRETMEDVWNVQRRVVQMWFNNERMGAVRDDGYYRHASLGGDWVESWSAFAGGNAIYVPPGATLADALAVLERHVTWASFHARMALHG